jgi:hypothetical protein
MGYPEPKRKMTVNDKLERAWIKAIVVYFKALARNFQGRTEKNVALSRYVFLPHEEGDKVGLRNYVYSLLTMDKVQRKFFP